MVPTTSLISALIGASVAFFGLVWRYRADYKRDIVRELLVSIQTAADQATEYWLLAPSDAVKETVAKCAALEARIMGYSERLEAHIDAARPHLRKIDTLGMEIPWSSFLNDLTGGQFANPQRDSDLVRAQGVQYSAAILIRDLRMAADRRLLGVMYGTGSHSS